MCSLFLPTQHVANTVTEVTPAMLSGITYGTFLLFGFLTLLGAGFIWWFFPETKGLSLEEMDTLFGSTGVAVADAQLMAEIQREVGLLDIIRDDDSQCRGEKGDKL